MIILTTTTVETNLPLSRQILLLLWRLHLKNKRSIDQLTLLQLWNGKCLVLGLSFQKLVPHSLFFYIFKLFLLFIYGHWSANSHGAVVKLLFCSSSLTILHRAAASATPMWFSYAIAAAWRRTPLFSLRQVYIHAFSHSFTWIEHCSQFNIPFALFLIRESIRHPICFSISKWSKKITQFSC